MLNIISHKHLLIGLRPMINNSTLYLGQHYTLEHLTGSTSEESTTAQGPGSEPYLLKHALGVK